MSSWNRRIKEMRDEVNEMWRECLKTDWHMKEKEWEREKTWESRFDSAVISFFTLITSLSFLLHYFTPDFSLFLSLRTIAVQAELCFMLTLKWIAQRKSWLMKELIWGPLKDGINDLFLYVWVNIVQTNQSHMWVCVMTHWFLNQSFVLNIQTSTLHQQSCTPTCSWTCAYSCFLELDGRTVTT